MDMLIEVARTGTINAPAAAVWATIADFGSADTYFPAIVDCVLEGSGIGARRHLRTIDGGITISELIELDDDAMAMGYRVVESTVPIEDYTSRLVVRPVEGGCEVTYSSRFRARAGTDPEELATFLREQLDSAIGGLAALHEPPGHDKPSAPATEAM